MATNLGTPQNWAPVSPSGGLTVQDLMGQIQNGQQQPIDLQSLMPKVVQGNPQNSAGPFTASMFQSAPTGGSYGQQLPLWRQALNFVDRPRNAVDTAINDALTAHQGLLGDLGAGAKGFMNGLTDKQYTDFGNILDTLGWKPQNENAPVHNVQTMKGNFNTNANLDTGLHKVTSFLGDVITDPLSYLTMGSEGVAKSGIQAGLKAAGEAVGKDALKGVGNDITDIAHNAGSAAYDQTVARLKTTAPTANPDLIDRLATKNSNDVMNQVLNAAKGARAEAGKSALNFNVPFTNINKSIFNKPSFLQPVEGVIGAKGVKPVEDALNGLGLNDAQKTQVYSKYGVGSAENLTPQMRDDLLNQVQSFQSTAKKLPTEQNVQQTVTPYTETVQGTAPIDRLGSQVGNPLKMPTGASSPANQTLQQLFDLARQNGVPAGREAEYIESLLGTISDKHGVSFDELLSNLDKQVKDKTGNLSNVLNMRKYGISSDAPLPKSIIPGNRMLEPGVQQIEQQIPRELFGQTADVGLAGNTAKQAAKNLSSGDFVADLAGKSPVGGAVSKLFSFMNPRAGEGTNTVWDKLGTLQGRQFDMNKVGMPQYQQILDKLTPEMQQLLPYLVENNLPARLTEQEAKALETFNKNPSLKDEAVNATRDLFSQFAKNETQVGTLTSTLPNYYYHMLNKKLPPDQLEKLMQNPYVGKSMKNTSNIARKAFPTLADWRNTLDGLQGELKSATDPEAKQQIQDALDHLSNLYETSPSKVMQARYAKSIKTQTFGEMFKDLQNQGLVRNTVTDIPDDYKNFVQVQKDSPEAKLGLPAGTYVHKDVLNTLKKTDKMTDPSTFNKVIDNINGVMNLWKSLPILYSPSHLKTRFVGDVMNAMMGGAKMGDFSDAQDLYSAALSGKMTAEQKAMWKKAVDNGIVRGHSGQNADIYENAASQPWIQKANDALYNNKVGSAMGNTLNRMDNQSRLALFLAGMKSYGDAGKAAMNVKKYLFNYNELTNSEKVIRTVVPFYTWMRNNLPLMVSQLAKNPRYFQTGNRAISQLNNGQPYNPYAADFLRIPNTNYMFDARMPMQDLDMLSQPGNTLVNAMPFASLPFEQHTNTNFFNGMPIDQTKIAGEPAGAGAMSKFILGQALAGGPATAVQDMVGNNKPWWENLFNIGIGGLTNQDPAKIQKEANWQQKAQQQLQRKAAQKKLGG